jgi:hypothetical protein
MKNEIEITPEMTGEAILSEHLVATTEGIKGEDVRDLMATAVEHRFESIAGDHRMADRQRLRIHRTRHQALCS